MNKEPNETTRPFKPLETFNEGVERQAIGRMAYEAMIKHTSTEKAILAQELHTDPSQLLADALNCIMDCYQFMDTYGTVYDAGDSRGVKQQELLDRMRGLIKLVADLPTTQEAN